MLHIRSICKITEKMWSELLLSLNLDQANLDTRKDVKIQIHAEDLTNDLVITVFEQSKTIMSIIKYEINDMIVAGLMTSCNLEEKCYLSNLQKYFAKYSNIFVHNKETDK